MGHYLLHILRGEILYPLGLAVADGLLVRGARIGRRRRRSLRAAQLECERECDPCEQKRFDFHGFSSGGRGRV